MCTGVRFRPILENPRRQPGAALPPEAAAPGVNAQLVVVETGPCRDGRAGFP